MSTRNDPNPTSTRSFSYDDKIRCLSREIAMRRQVYPKRVFDRKMTQNQADWEIECMAAILAEVKNAAGRRDQLSYPGAAFGAGIEPPSKD